MARSAASGRVMPFRDASSVRRTVSDVDHSIAPVRQNARIGLIFNGRAHGNLARAAFAPDHAPSMDWAAPRTPDDLAEALARFAEQRIDALVVDGGDGTIRDILSEAPRHFPWGLPAMAIVPSGKTNALANDLGIPAGWTVTDAIRSVSAGRIKQRAPIEIRRDDAAAPALRGFLFGAGAFVKGTAIAQDTHRMGAFRGIAVGLSLAAAIGQTIFAGRGNHWRQGDAMRIDLSDGRRVAKSFYIVLGTTLKRLPLGLKPFGHVRDGFKLLGVEAPPRHLILTVPALLAGSESAWLERLGYHRADVDRMRLSLDTDFILDGESYAGGDLSIARGAPVDFVVP